MTAKEKKLAYEKIVKLCTNYEDVNFEKYDLDEDFLKGRVTDYLKLLVGKPYIEYYGYWLSSYVLNDLDIETIVKLKNDPYYKGKIIPTKVYSSQIVDEDGDYVRHTRDERCGVRPVIRIKLYNKEVE